MTSNPPTKHHYIPAFYLKKWAAADGKVTEFTKPRHEIVARKIMPDRTGYQERLYELKGFEPSCWFPRETEPVRRIISIEN